MSQIKTFENFEKIEGIKHSMSINDYIQNDLIFKNGQYHYINDDDKMRPLDISFVGDSIIILNKQRIQLSKETVDPGGLFFDTRYPDEISQLSTGAEGINVPFGFKEWRTSPQGSKYVYGNDCFFKAEIIE